MFSQTQLATTTMKIIIFHLKLGEIEKLTSLNITILFMNIKMIV